MTFIGGWAVQMFHWAELSAHVMTQKLNYGQQGKINTPLLRPSLPSPFFLFLLPLFHSLSCSLSLLPISFFPAVSPSSPFLRLSPLVPLSPSLQTLGHSSLPLVFCRTCISGLCGPWRRWPIGGPNAAPRTHVSALHPEDDGEGIIPPFLSEILLSNFLLFL